MFTKTQAFVGFLRVMAISSTIENVNGAKYANAELSLPPLPEQSAIVRFLDHADRRIRRYIRAKQKLIKLLEEQKQA
ncbi:MAG: restriction endonuclease subunit S, partial [Gemmatimonadetes bacterium]|nr:restriction endonuclease subunit S [Gemmatimonadota bacterium]